MSVREYLIEDVKNLSEHDVNKLYKYVRRYLVANIEGLIDPLETSSNSEYMAALNVIEEYKQNTPEDVRSCLGVECFAKQRLNQQS